MTERLAFYFNQSKFLNQLITRPTLLVEDNYASIAWLSRVFRSLNLFNDVKLRVGLNSYGSDKEVKPESTMELPVYTKASNHSFL